MSEMRDIVIAMLIDSRDHSLISFGEGNSKYAAKAEAIINAPEQYDSIPMAVLEWEYSMMIEY